MIEVIYHPKRLRLTCAGHAQNGKKGEDLVCAAVSALVLTMASNVATLAAQEKVEHPVLRIQEGDAWISCVPKKGLGREVTLICDAVCGGFELLETMHPESIRFRVEGQYTGPFGLL